MQINPKKNSSDINTYSVILLAAGSSERLGLKVNKVLLPLTKDKRPMIDYSLSLFLEDGRCSTVCLVTREDEQGVFANWIDTNHKGNAAKIHYVQGGSSRQESVENGIKVINNEADYVLIHDGARPLISKDLIDSLFISVQREDAVTLALPSQDTMNRVVDGQKAVETLDRNEIWNIQTPQAFKISLLEKAIEKAHEDQLQVNEEGQLLLNMDHPVHIILGNRRNLKVTTQEDLEIVKAIVQFNSIL